LGLRGKTTTTQALSRPIRSTKNSRCRQIRIRIHRWSCYLQKSTPVHSLY